MLTLISDYDMPGHRPFCCCQDEALEVVPVLKREVEKLRLGLSEEVTGREEDLHAKDGEIATLKAKVCAHHTTSHTTPYTDVFDCYQLASEHSTKETYVDVGISNATG